MNKDLINTFFKDRNRTSFSRPIIIAHRGASGYEPENTLSSFKRALEISTLTEGFVAIELDVFCCKSREKESCELIVIHDETIDRTTNGHGHVQDMTYEQLKRYDAGNGEHIPLLSEVLDFINRHTILKHTLINIELKGPHTAQPVAKLLDLYTKQKNWAAHNFIISSFDIEAIQEFKNYLPQIKTGALFFRSKADLIKITKQAHASYIILDYQSITQNLITKAHAKGLFIFVYTVNDITIARELSTWDIDGIITDYPDILENTELNSLVLH